MAFEVTAKQQTTKWMNKWSNQKASAPEEIEGARTCGLQHDLLSLFHHIVIQNECQNSKEKHTRCHYSKDPGLVCCMVSFHFGRGTNRDMQGAV
jgi:hypothetical protein